MTAAQAVVCGECNVGHFRGTGAARFICDKCGHDVIMADLDDVWFDFRSNVVRAYSERSIDVRHALLDATGLDFVAQDMAGGCFALGVIEPSGREILVNNGDADLPDDAEIMHDHGGSLMFAIYTPDDDAGEYAHEWQGNDLDDLVEHAKKALA